MDFGVVGLDGLVVGSSDTSGFSSLGSSDPETKQKWYESASASASGFLHKQERSASGGAAEDEDLRSSKLAKTSDDLSSSSSSSKGMLFTHRHPASLLRSNSSFYVSDSNQHQPHHQMLCFSSTKSDHFPLDKTSSLSAASPNFFHSSSAPRNPGCNYGGLNGGSMHGGAFIGVRAPFTPSQWMELEHQALIYKYITANVPVPSNLLIPIRKALESAGFSTLSGGFLRPAAVGWGAFNVGFSNNSDPEPGRCRRTDGKKWRCSRDAVADQKYCERHMNRGRHRSRKPVEGQAGHSHSVAGASNITAAAAATNNKLIPSSASMAAVPANVSSNSLSFANQHFKNLHRAGSHPPPSASAAAQINRMLITTKENGGIGLHDSTTSGLSVMSPSIDMKQPKQLPFAIQKQQNPFEESPRTDFGLISSNFLLSPSQKNSSMMAYRSFNPSEGITTSQEAAETQNSLRQFFNNWPKNQSDSSSVSWSNSNLDLQSDRTQLSISIPMATSDFRSSTSSPANEKLTLSPLKSSSQELDPIQMGLAVGNVVDEPNNRQANWIPVSWESSMGGPLGEVLHSTNNNGGESKSSSILNLMTEGWDNSPSLGSSPTGVLQKTAFGSFSNSSTGSSPRIENNKTHEVGGGGSSQCSDRLGSTFVNSSSSLPSV